MNLASSLRYLYVYYINLFGKTEFVLLIKKWEEKPVDIGNGIWKMSRLNVNTVNKETKGCKVKHSPVPTFLVIRLSGLCRRLLTLVRNFFCLSITERTGALLVVLVGNHWSCWLQSCIMFNTRYLANGCIQNLAFFQSGLWELLPKSAITKKMLQNRVHLENEWKFF